MSILLLTILWVRNLGKGLWEQFISALVGSGGADKFGKSMLSASWCWLSAWAPWFSSVWPLIIQAHLFPGGLSNRVAWTCLHSSWHPRGQKQKLQGVIRPRNHSYHLHCILLVRESHRASPDSRKEERDFISLLAKSQSRRAYRMGWIGVNIFGNNLPHR